MDNPCAQHPFYREFVLHCCPQLKQLDGTAVTKEERIQAAKKLTTKVLDEILGKPTTSAASPTATPSREGSAKPVKAKPTASPNPASPNPASPRSSSTGQVLYTTVQTQRAMLLAIVSLLPELTGESLEMLQKEVEERLEKQRGKSVKPVS
ncbi:Protein C21orf2 [Angomonas deanei]|uniref:Uncharacterized protein n=1 Tax=Angomonas deanei TaxID=59799 RepID=S9VI79_9TRYP|nr:hypothetical protein AGDE_11359 [Angomonas deanei]EPY40578.1 Protein C21orf2 [Angomonas deanei]EPY41247.1 Protein C21orf2 [Angomonas deanei]CAD2214153.1 hypothetical protein, conserved [Angomonas deanei]|eukprot:EPY26403.1 hypothetical protein AGDE_11359 [Angomonas deanei]